MRAGRMRIHRCCPLSFSLSFAKRKKTAVFTDWALSLNAYHQQVLQSKVLA